MLAILCTIDRSFSTLSRTITWPRNTMKQDRLRNIVVVAIEKDIFITILNSYLEKIVDAFTAVGNRHFFQDASSYLYMRLCPPVDPSVGPSVRP